MNLPFIRFFKKDKAEEGSVAVAPQPPAPIEKPTSERLGKTVLPNSSRIVGLEPIGNFPILSPESTPAQAVPATSRKISLGGNGSIAVGPKLSQSEPAAERTIALPFADLIPNLPSDLLKPVALDPERRIVLQASEVERGMSTGHPTVLLRAIYKQAPEFFISEVPAADMREVSLPFAKVVEQFAAFQVRDDQMPDQEYPQLVTPFLQVTLEDNARFGKSATRSAAKENPAVQPKAVADAKPAVAAAAPPVAPVAAPAAADAAPKAIAPIKFSAPPPIPAAPVAPAAPATPAAPAAASAPAPAPAAKAPPPLAQATESAAAKPVPADAAPKAIAPIKFSAPPPAPTAAAAPAPAPTATAPAAAAPAPQAVAPITSSTLVPASTPAPAPTVEAPLPLDQSPPSPPTAAKISPNGTGAPAAERVPASSGSPVPTPLPSPLAPLPPTRIPFKISAPSNDLRKTSKFPAPKASAAAVDFANAGPRVSLSLRNILRSLAPFQLSGPIDAVPETALIEIPFSIIQPQLSLGRVAISPTQFQAALPDEHRALFIVDTSGTPVPLALQDILQNLPGESLQLRGDQEEPEAAEAFETPFSQKASEDAARMKVSANPVSKATAGATEATVAPVAAATQAPASVPPSAAPAPESAAPLPAPPAVEAAKKPAIESKQEATKKAPVELAKEPSKPALAPQAETAPVAKPVVETPRATAPHRRTALQTILDTDDALDAKSVVGHVSRLPGVSACTVVFSDGLSLAGNIPAEYEADALCAIAPSIIQRFEEQLAGAKLGALNSVTLFCGKVPVSLFAHGTICLAAIHSGGEIAPEIREQLGRTTQELARMYAQAA